METDSAVAGPHQGRRGAEAWRGGPLERRFLLVWRLKSCSGENQHSLQERENN